MRKSRESGQSAELDSYHRDIVPRAGGLKTGSQWGDPCSTPVMGKLAVTILKRIPDGQRHGGPGLELEKEKVSVPTIDNSGVLDY